jgi:hypothetical protein
MTSFPYLAVARKHNVPYCVVLWLSDQLDAKSPAYGPMPYHIPAAWPSNPMLWEAEPWAIATICGVANRVRVAARRRAVLFLRALRRSFGWLTIVV